MKIKFYFGLFAGILVLVATFVIPCSASEQIKKESKTIEAAKKTVPPGKAVLSASRYVFEPVVEGTLITHDFIIKNKGKGPLKINRVKTG